MTATRAAVEADLGLDSAVESAGFVRVLARADGDALAASGLLARALSARGTPYQLSVGPTVGDRATRLASAASDTADATDEATVVVGTGSSEADHRFTADGSATRQVCELVADLGVEPDPILALAGAAAAGVDPGTALEECREAALDEGTIESGPGLATPTDAADGLAHTTLCRGPWSGDLEAAESLVAAGASPTVTASAVAIDAVGSEDASTRAAHAVEGVLRPHRIAGDHPFATVEGYADVLAALAREAPGLGVALVAGDPDRVADRAIEVWREHGRRAHAALDRATTRRYDGLVVADVDESVEAVARLVADYRSPEPAALAIDAEGGEAALATAEARPLADALESAAEELAIGDGYDVGPRRGYLRYEGDRETVVTAVRRAL